MNRILPLLAALFALISSAFAAVNVNTATKEQMMTLDGIGEVKAQAIIDYRAKNGPFKSIADLDKVPGIGAATLKQFEKDVSLSGATVVEPIAAPVKKDARPAAKAPAKSDAKGDKAPKAEAKIAPPAKTEVKAAAPAKMEQKAYPAVKAKAAATEPKATDAKSAKQTLAEDDAKKNPAKK